MRAHSLSWSRSPTSTAEREPVRSRQNRKVVEAVRLQRARDDDLTLLQGPKLIAEAVAAGVSILRAFYIDGTEPPRLPAATDVVAVSEPVMERLTPTRDDWGPVAVAHIPAASPRANRPVLVAHSVADPGNLGTMIRSAAAFGYDVVVIGGTDAWSPKVLRAGAGGHFRTNVSSDLSLPGRQLVAAVVAGGEPPGSMQVSLDHALLIGSEAEGLPASVIEASERRVTIPMASGESLNAGTAAAVLMYALGGSNPGGWSEARD